MGFFSWDTSDTKESIMNVHTIYCKPVYLYCPDGTIIAEYAYDGFGFFGGYEAVDLLAKWNCPNEYIENDRENNVEIGCKILFHHYCDPVKYPLKFSFSLDKKYEDLEPAKTAENQGYFDMNFDFE